MPNPDAFDPWPDARVHLEWGEEAARQAGQRGHLVVVVDVLSFSSSVAIVVGRGATAWSATAAQIQAAGGSDALVTSLGVKIAGERTLLPPSPGRRSLSPASVLGVEPGEQILFTSLNGAMAVAAATEAGAAGVVGGALVNASAVGRYLARCLTADSDLAVTVVACGERWETVLPGTGTGGVRPGIEDLLGVGAIVVAIAAQRSVSLSAEATVARTLYDAVGADLACLVAESVSGRELVGKGFADDVTIASSVDSVDAVPLWTPEPEAHPRRASGPVSFRGAN